MGPWSVKLVGGKDAWAPRGPPACPTCTQNPVFTPALPPTPSLCPLVFGGLWMSANRKGIFSPMFHAQSLLLFFAQVICLKGAPWF